MWRPRTLVHEDPETSGEIIFLLEFPNFLCGGPKVTRQSARCPAPPSSVASRKARPWAGCGGPRPGFGKTGRLSRSSRSDSESDRDDSGTHRLRSVRWARPTPTELTTLATCWLRCLGTSLIPVERYQARVRLSVGTPSTFRRQLQDLPAAVAHLHPDSASAAAGTADPQAARELRSPGVGRLQVLPRSHALAAPPGGGPGRPI